MDNSVIELVVILYMLLCQGTARTPPQINDGKQRGLIRVFF